MLISRRRALLAGVSAAAGLVFYSRVRRQSPIRILACEVVRSVATLGAAKCMAFGITQSLLAGDASAAPVLVDIPPRGIDPLLGVDDASLIICNEHIAGLVSAKCQGRFGVVAVTLRLGADGAYLASSKSVVVCPKGRYESLEAVPKNGLCLFTERTSVEGYLAGRDLFKARNLSIGNERFVGTTTNVVYGVATRRGDIGVVPVRAVSSSDNLAVLSATKEYSNPVWLASAEVLRRYSRSVLAEVLEGALNRPNSDTNGALDVLYGGCGVRQRDES